jgi:hypothetical protein
VPWRPDDWNEWPAERWPATRGESSHVCAVREVLLRLPDCKSKTIVELTRGPATELPCLTTLFRRVVTVRLAAVAAGPLVLPPACDVVVAVDAIGAGGADETISRIHAALIEGGVFLATFAAQARGPWPFPMRQRAARSGFHEVELQFRLRRTGFQGLRLRRVRGAAHEPERIVCMAVRRALN